MKVTLELSKNDPKAREVLARTIVAERDIVVDILADHPRALGKTVRATVSAMLDELEGD